jgi:peptidoglycan hydrolase CwlO-like protein
MTSNKYIPIRINVQRILIGALLILSVIMIYLIINQKNEIGVLKSKSFEQNATIQVLTNKVNELEDEKSNFEEQISDLEGRINDLENRKVVITYK